MLLKMLKSKIHRATVTDANLDYEGSIAIDPVIDTSGVVREIEFNPVGIREPEGRQISPAG